MRAPTWDGPTSDAAAMSFGFSGRFWPISRPLFQGARRQRGKGFSVVIVVSDVGPVHLSAGSPSTGCDNLPRKDAITPKAVTSAGADHTLLQVPRWTSAGYSRAHVQCGPPQEP